jgi:hypothetical protein
MILNTGQTLVAERSANARTECGNDTESIRRKREARTDRSLVPATTAPSRGWRLFHQNCKDSEPDKQQRQQIKHISE